MKTHLFKHFWLCYENSIITCNSTERRASSWRCLFSSTSSFASWGAERGSSGRQFKEVGFLCLCIISQQFFSVLFDRSKKFDIEIKGISLYLISRQIKKKRKIDKNFKIYSYDKWFSCMPCTYISLTRSKIPKKC